MKQIFEAFLSGTENKVDGIARPVSVAGYTTPYDFKSIDGRLHILIGKDESENWVRIGGTEPYFSSWVNELAQQIAKHKRRQL